MRTDPFGLRTATIGAANGEYDVDSRTPNRSRCIVPVIRCP